MILKYKTYNNNNVILLFKLIINSSKRPNNKHDKINNSTVFISIHIWESKIATVAYYTQCIKHNGNVYLLYNVCFFLLLKKNIKLVLCELIGMHYLLNYYIFCIYKYNRKYH